VEKSIGSKNFLKFYFLSGIAASIGFVLFRNILSLYQGTSVLGPAVGASGAVVAMFAVVAMLYPEAEVLLYFVVPMKIKPLSMLSEDLNCLIYLPSPQESIFHWLEVLLLQHT